MATSTIGAISTEQFLAMPQQYDASGNRVKEELIRGEVVPMGFPAQRHDILKNQIGRSIVLFLSGRPDLDLEAYVEIAYAVTEHDAYAPDVSVVRRSRLLQASERIIAGAPEIAVEVVSPTDKATHIKSKIAAYLDNGSGAVWIVYPETRSIEIHTADGMHEVKGDQPLEDELLPGFSEPVSRFFEGF